MIKTNRGVATQDIFGTISSALSGSDKYLEQLSTLITAQKENIDKVEKLAKTADSLIKTVDTLSKTVNGISKNVDLILKELGVDKAILKK